MGENKCLYCARKLLSPFFIKTSKKPLPFCGKSCYIKYYEHESDRNLAEWFMKDFQPEKLSAFETRKLRDRKLIVYDNVTKAFSITDKARRLLKESKTLQGDGK